MRTVVKKDLKILEKIKQKAIKGGGKGGAGLGCPPPEPTRDDE